MVRPAVSVSHFAESAGTYVDTFGVEIPEITSRLGQARLGPEVQYVYRLNRSIRLQPRAGLELVSNFSGETTAAGLGAIDGGAGSRADTRGRTEFGVRALTSRGVSMDLSGTYDGIGTAGFGAFAGRLLVNVPMK
jgi:outer membrane autotransporter protein